MLAAVPPGMDICVHLCGDSGWRTESVQFSEGACCNPHSEGCRGRITLQEGRRKPPSPFLLRNIAKVEHQVFHRDIYTVFGRFPSGKTKTSDFLNQNIRTFRVKHRNFASEKSDVSAFPGENAVKSLFSRFGNIPERGYPRWLPWPFLAR